MGEWLDDTAVADATPYVERRLCGPMDEPSPLAAGEGSLDDYRSALAAVQTHCFQRHRKLFEELDVSQQYAVLSLLEDGDRQAGFDHHARLVPALVRYAAEAFFDAVQGPSRSR